ncbi:hypothetical protein ScalyP_jg9616 [Parmales sp. scaly parma]|nr:hypothetical protein ScalyP_jg9616 [Parmales sp. scaly parma]
MASPSPKRPLNSLSIREVGYLLAALGLEKHVSSFERMAVDGVLLAELKVEKDLEGELGITSHVQRLNLISHVKDFQKGVAVELLEPPRLGGSRTRALSSLNVEEVSTLLKRIELPSVVELFQTARVDGSLLGEIKEEDLKTDKEGLKVDSRLQRTKLLKKIGDFKAYGVPSDMVGEEKRNDAGGEEEEEEEEEEGGGRGSNADETKLEDFDNDRK